MLPHQVFSIEMEGAGEGVGAGLANFLLKLALNHNLLDLSLLSS
jgi:hypothetical protein